METITQDKLYVIVRGWNDKQYRDAKAKIIFNPTSIVMTSYNKDRLVARAAAMNHEETVRTKNRLSRYVHKVALASKFPKQYEAYLLNQYIKDIHNDIERKWSREDEAAAVLNAWHDYCSILRKADKIDEIINTSIDDFDLTVKAEESISIRYHSSTWSVVAEGTIKGVKVRGVHIGDSHSV